MVDNPGAVGVVYFHGSRPVFAEQHDYREEMAPMQALVDSDAPQVPTDRGAHVAASAYGKVKSPARVAALAAQRAAAFATVSAWELRAQS